MNARFLCFLLLALTPLSLAAQEKSKAKAPKADPPAAEAPAAAPAATPDAPVVEGSSDTSSTQGGMNFDLGKSLGGFDFDKMGFSTLHFESSTGNVVIDGPIDFRSKQLSLQCDHLTASDKDKIMIATGGPVHITQGDIKATCGKLTYLIDKKRYRLENNPVIFQKDVKSGKTTKYYAPIITVDQDESGKSNVSFEQIPGTVGPAGIESIVDKNSAPKPAQGKKPAPKKVENNNMSLIPQIDLGS